MEKHTVFIYCKMQHSKNANFPRNDLNSNQNPAFFPIKQYIMNTFHINILVEYHSK